MPVKKMTAGASRIAGAFCVCAAFALLLPAQQPGTRQEPQQQQPTTPEPTDGNRPVQPVAPGVSAPVDPKTYVIGPGDVLMIKVWKEPELSGAVQVRPDGKLTLQLIGEIKAADLTPEQLTNNIVEALTKFINKPEVMISVQAVLSKKYYMTGEIGRTGMYPLVVPTTVLEALSNAGGFREFANKKRIVIMRGKERIKFNYQDVVKGKNLEQNIYLQDGDHIFVPD